MLQAITNKGERITLALLEQAEINLLRQVKFYCPGCKKRVIVKAGSKQVAHFAHVRQETCIASGGEGPYHEAGKLDLYNWLRKQGVHVELEKYFAKIKQRADLFVQIGKHKIVLEYQCAAISIPELIKRTKGFQRLNITPIWILGGNRLNRRHAKTINLTSTDLHFIHQFNSNHAKQLLYYCPNKKQFAIINQLTLTGRKETIGRVSYYPIYSRTLTQLFPQEVTNTQYRYQLWIKEKQRLRLVIPSRGTKPEREWREWLYLKRQTTATMSAWIHLPVEDQWKMTVAPWNWQSRLYMDLFNKYQSFHLQDCHDFLQTYRTKVEQYPLICDNGDPIAQYLQFFIQTKQLKQIKPKIYQLTAPIQTYDTLDIAMKKDQQLIRFLKNKA